MLFFREILSMWKVKQTCIKLTDLYETGELNDQVWISALHVRGQLFNTQL